MNVQKHKCLICGELFETPKYANPERCKYCSQKCRKKAWNIYAKDYMRRWWKNHPDKPKPNRTKQYHLECLFHYGGNPPKCVCCGENHVEFLTIDHIAGNGTKERKQHKNFIHWLKKMGFPEGYQVLCSNCNMAKGRNKGKFCPIHHPNG